MNKWIAEFDLEDGDTMPEHMDLEYKGARIDFHCRPLEQEPTTKNDLGVDLISRAEVLKLIYDYKENHSENRKEYPINYGTLIDMIRWVRNLPSVTPQEPKTGHWERVTDKTKHLVWECDRCGWQQRFNTNFCPDCGANMCEAQESEDNK